MTITDILVTFYKHEPSLLISNDGSQKGPGYESPDDYYYDHSSEESEEYFIGAFHHIQFGFFPFIWKNLLFLVTADGNIYRLTNKGMI